MTKCYIQIKYPKFLDIESLDLHTNTTAENLVHGYK